MPDGRRGSARRGDAPSIWDIWAISGLDMLETSGEAALIIDVAGTVLFCNAASERLQRRPRSEIIGRPLRHLSNADIPIDPSSAVWDLLLGGQHWAGDIWVNRGDGSRVPVYATRSPIFAADGSVAGILSLATDRTTELEAKQALEASETQLRKLAERFHRVFDESPVGKMIVGPDLRIVEVNQAMCQCLGYRAGALQGASIDMLVPPTEVASQRAFWQALFAEEMDRLQIRHRYVRADGTEVVARVSAALLHEEASGSLTAISEVEDVTEQVRADEDLERRALTDPLTGLPNRALLHDRLSRALARLSRETAVVAVMFVDVDRFKLVNDVLGHDAGDELLIAIGLRLTQAVRATDTVARFGGDEFVVVFEDIADLDDVLSFGERLVATARTRLSLENHEVSPRVSVGITFTSDSTRSPNSLIRDADLAMYAAKQSGGNRCEIYDADMRDGNSQ
jgi:diguanylate cyclase (GGDEF)-like protein/PAS domain S-box-containing protein